MAKIYKKIYCANYRLFVVQKKDYLLCKNQKKSNS